MSASQIRQAVEQAFRDFTVDGLASSGAHDPRKSEVRYALGELLETTLSAIGSGLQRYETKALMDAETGEADGQLAYVWGDGTASNNTVYQTDAGVWSEATWYFDAVAGVVQPLVDDAETAAVAATAAADAFGRADQPNLFSAAQLALADLSIWSGTQPVAVETVNGRQCLRVINGFSSATFPRSAFEDSGLISASVVVEALTGAATSSRLRVIQRDGGGAAVADNIALFGTSNITEATPFSLDGLALHADAVTVDYMIQSGPNPSTAWVRNMLIASGESSAFRPSPYQPAEPKWQRLLNRVADPGFTLGVMPEINVGQPVMEAITDPDLLAMGAVNGFKMTGSASAQVLALFPVPEGAAGEKYVLMAAYAYSPDGAWPPSASNSVYHNAAGGTVTTGLKHEYVDISDNVRLYVSSGLIPANAAKFAIGKFDLQASGVTNRLLTGIGYWIADVPLSRSDVLHDEFAPAALIGTDATQEQDRARALALTYDQPNLFTRDQLTFDDLTGWQMTGTGGFSAEIVNGRRTLRVEQANVFREFPRFRFEESGQISASLWIERLENASRTFANFIIDQYDDTGTLISTAAGVRAIVNMGTGSYSEPRQLTVAGLPLHADCATVRFSVVPGTSAGNAVNVRDLLIAQGDNPEFRLPPETGGGGGGSGGLSGTITIANADKIVQLGDSYTESVYPLKDKHPAARVSEQSEWCVRSWGVSGYDNAELANALLTGMTRYGTNVAEIAPSHTIIVSRANDNFIASLDWRYWVADAERLIGIVQSFGSKVILSAEHPKTLNAINWAQERAFADANDLPFIDVASDAHKFEYSTSQYIWEGTHPGVRTNSVLWKPILDFVQTMPRPRTGLRIFRPRDTGAALADLRYNNLPDRARAWKEITTGHRALKLASSSKYDAVAAGPNAQTSGDQEYYNDEYSMLSRGEAVGFENVALVEAILPAMGRDVSRVKLNISGAPGATIYALDRREPPPFALVNRRGFIGASAPATVGDVYSVPDSVNFAVVGNVGDMVILAMGDGHTTPNAAGTLTRVSGTGPATIDYTGVVNARDPAYYDDFNDPVGTWEAIAGGEIGGASVQRYMQGDKIAFLVEDAGAFDLTAVSVEYEASQPKPELRRAALLPASGAQLLPQPLCGEATELDDWNITGTVAGVAPDANSGAAPSGVTKLARIDDENYIDQTFDLPADRPNGSELEIEVWCRRYLPMFDPTADIATSPINSDTFDHATLQIGFGLPADDLAHSALSSHLVPPGWVAIKHRVQVPSQYVGPGDGLTRRLTIKGGDETTIEVARVTATWR